MAGAVARSKNARFVKHHVNVWLSLQVHTSTLALLLLVKSEGSRFSTVLRDAACTLLRDESSRVKGTLL